MSVTFTALAGMAYCGKKQIKSLSTVKSLARLFHARWAILGPESQAIRISPAGGTSGAPTSSDLMIDVGQPVEITTSLADARLLEEATGAKINVVAELVEQAAAKDARITELDAQLVAIEAKRPSNKPKL